MDLFAPADAAWAIVPILFFFVWLAFAAAVFALVMWIMYGVIWRAVRRGLQEFHGVRPARESPSQYFGFATWTPPEEPETAPASDETRSERRPRSGRLTR